MDECDLENFRFMLTLFNQGGTILEDWLDRRSDDEVTYALRLLDSVRSNQENFVNSL